MTIYSYSSLSCYEQCPQKFKLQYVDKVKTEVKENIELFLGKRVHETLRKLYCSLQYPKKNNLEDLLVFLHNQWTKNWKDSIVIVKEGYCPEIYLRMAEQCIVDYYNRYKPFDRGRNIAIEKYILFNLDENGNYRLCGCIDRVAKTEDGCYQIHDYKTCSRFPSPEYLQKNWQLALYAIGLRARYPYVRNIKLIWHFLKFDKEIDSTWTDRELEELRHNIIQLIDKIESDEKFSANFSRLCNWCRFRFICRR